MPLTNARIAVPRRVPVLLNYSVGKTKFEKVPDQVDIELLFADHR